MPNESKNKKYNIHIGEKITIIGLQLEGDYPTYRNKAIASLVEANTFRSMYTVFIEKSSSSLNKSELEEAQQEHRALYLKDIMNKQGLILRSDVEIIIDEKTRAEINKSRSTTAKLLGDFWGKFIQAFYDLN